jgi:hypothetical protein
MTVIQRDTDLTALLSKPVVFTRVIDGARLRIAGKFTDLCHGADNPRHEFRRDEAGGSLRYQERGQARSTAVCIPYGSTIEVAQ